jgi:hypothetical protein
MIAMEIISLAIHGFLIGSIAYSPERTISPMMEKARVIAREPKNLKNSTSAFALVGLKTSNLLAK